MHNPLIWEIPIASNISSFPHFLLLVILLNIYHTFGSCPTVPGYSVLFSAVFAFYFHFWRFSIAICSSPESLQHVHSTK